MGGMSSERDISLRTGKNVTAGLKNAGYDVVAVDVTNHVFLSRIKAAKPDVCFIALHGRFGEDGAVQGCLELMGIPYTGSGVLSSALCMDKAVSKKMFESENILTPPYCAFAKGKFSTDEMRMRVDNKISFPVVVKPVHEGSTIGITVVKRKKDFSAAVRRAFRYDNEILAEKFIGGVEVTCPVLGNSKPQCLPPIEIVSNTASGYYDFKAKYAKGGSTHIIPPRLPRDIVQKIRTLAVKAHECLQCGVLSRVDMIVSRGIPYVLEVNTIPGMTETSLFPESARAAGLSFESLLTKIIQFSLEKKN